MIVCDVINLEDIDVIFSLIGGFEYVKKLFYELVILFLQWFDFFIYGKFLCLQKGVFLFGLFGIGKIFLVKVIVKELGVVFINVCIVNLMSKWFGDVQKLGMFFYVVFFFFDWVLVNGVVL